MEETRLARLKPVEVSPDSARFGVFESTRSSANFPLTGSCAPQEGSSTVSTSAGDLFMDTQAPLPVVQEAESDQEGKASCDSEVLPLRRVSSAPPRPRVQRSAAHAAISQQEAHREQEREQARCRKRDMRQAAKRTAAMQDEGPLGSDTEQGSADSGADRLTRSPRSTFLAWADQGPQPRGPSSSGSAPELRPKGNGQSCSVDNGGLAPALFNVEVRIRADQPPVPLVVRKGDRAEKVAAEFATRHVLAPQLAQRLYEMLEQQLRVYHESAVASEFSKPPMLPASAQSS